MTNFPSGHHNWAINTRLEYPLAVAIRKGETKIYTR